MRGRRAKPSFVSTIGLALLLGCGGNKDGASAGGTGGSGTGQGGSGPSAGVSHGSGGAAGGSVVVTGGQLGSGGGVGTGGQPDAGGTAGHGSGGSGALDGGVGPSTDGGPVSSNCTGAPWPTGGDPTKAGPFQVTSDKNVGPLAGAVPDPVYGNTQQRFNVYRPTDLAQGGYCHPIILWGNGHT